MPQLVPSQVAIPFGSVGQGVHRVPQLLAEELETQAPVQGW
jgi:hypothetical protein